MAKKTYEVVGDAVVHGCRKGETFEASLAAHEEALLVEAGHVVVAKAKKAEAVAVEDVLGDAKKA